MRASAGHLILPCDGFEKVKDTKGIETKAKVFVAEPEPVKVIEPPWVESPATKKVRFDKSDMV
jgi:hypothetical protein